MDTFVTFKFDLDDFRNVVLITDVEDLYFSHDNIFDHYSSELGDHFTVLVDLIMRNGFSFNRFVSLTFSEKSNCTSHLVISRDVSDEIKQSIKSYLNKYPQLLDESALTQSIKSFILKH